MVILVPDDSLWRVKKADNGVVMGVCQLPGGTEIGVQIMEPHVGDWAFQFRTFQQLGMRMVSPSYIGPLSGIPNRVMMTDGMCPLVFQRDKLHWPFFNVKRHFLSERLERLDGKAVLWS